MISLIAVTMRISNKGTMVVKRPVGEIPGNCYRIQKKKKKKKKKSFNLGISFTVHAGHFDSHFHTKLNRTIFIHSNTRKCKLVIV